MAKFTLTRTMRLIELSEGLEALERIAISRGIDFGEIHGSDLFISALQSAPLFVPTSHFEAICSEKQKVIESIIESNKANKLQFCSDIAGMFDEINLVPILRDLYGDGSDLSGVVEIAPVQVAGIAPTPHCYVLL